MPYFFIQPIMSNTREYKIVLFNGKAIYTAYSPTSVNQGFKFSIENSREECRFHFAETALEMFKKRCPYAIADGLVRVDIFENQAGKLVVNEFESLEAGYSHAHISKTGIVQSLLDQYWVDKLFKCFSTNYNRTF